MFKYALILTLCSAIIGCSTVNQTSNSRNIAGVLKADTWTDFIRAFSTQTRMSEEKVEEAILAFLKSKPKNAKRSNAALAGLTDDQIKNISSLNDDVPYIGKLKKWSLENMDLVFPNLKAGAIEDIYKNVVIKDRGLFNPYALSTRAKLVEKKGQLLVKSTMSQNNKQIIEQMANIKSKESKQAIVSGLKELKKRAQSEPALVLNGHEIMKSAILIEQKTGLRGIGNGCEDFIKNANRSVLESKANVDIERALIIERMAYEKNQGRQFASIDDVSGVRFTQQEIDEATELAFQRVLNYSKTQAKDAVKKLKSKPCRVY